MKLVKKALAATAIAAGLMIGSAAVASASGPVACYPSEDGGQYVLYYDSGSGYYALFLQ